MTTQWMHVLVTQELLASAMPVLDPVSPNAAVIRHLFMVVLIICLIIFVIVVGLIVVSLLRFRARDSRTPAQTFGSHRAEIGWTIPPVVIVLVLAVSSAMVIISDNAAPANETAAVGAADLTVIGHQWWWEVRYAGSTAVTANEIHVPVGRKLRVQVDSADVIHSFWVPQLAPKKDMIRGHPNFVWLQADRAEVYEGACAEFCGDQHAWMRFTVVAEDESAYQEWLAHQAQTAPVPATVAARAGRDIFFAQTCANCHAIGGTSAVANAAPDLTHFASRKDLAAGVIANTPQNLARWLRAPQRVKPGCQMPTFNLSDQQLEQLIAYLETLR
jgi:cytochrome c oxidase subunit 2